MSTTKQSPFEPSYSLFDMLRFCEFTIGRRYPDTIHVIGTSDIMEWEKDPRGKSSYQDLIKRATGDKEDRP